jgi:hypothetical protein
MRDIVFPHNNEQEFYAMAQKLGVNELVLVHPSKDAAARAPQPPAGLKVKHAVLAEPRKARDLRKQGNMIFVRCSDQDRTVLEQGAADVLFGAESSQSKDYIHQRGSGFNQVFAELARKNNVAIGFSLAEILSATGSVRARLMGRMMQNIAICRKYHVRMVAGSFASDQWEMRSPHDMQSFFVELGMHSSEAANALR